MPTTYKNLLKRLPGFINESSEVLQNLLIVIARKIDELDSSIQSASELNQTKKKLLQVLKEWNLTASPAHDTAKLKEVLQNRYSYHDKRGSKEGIVQDIELLCNSNVDIFDDPPKLNWFLGVNYPVSKGMNPLNYSDASYGYLINTGLVLKFAIDNNLLSENEIKEEILKNSVPCDLDVLLEVTDDESYLL